jgi:membrane associated rhomboid family serine protease
VRKVGAVILGFVGLWFIVGGLAMFFGVDTQELGDGESAAVGNALAGLIALAVGSWLLKRAPRLWRSVP